LLSLSVRAAAASLRGFTVWISAPSDRVKRLHRCYPPASPFEGECLISGVAERTAPFLGWPVR
jgi:hypothetical protein